MCVQVQASILPNFCIQHYLHALTSISSSSPLGYFLSTSEKESKRARERESERARERESEREREGGRGWEGRGGEKRREVSSGGQQWFLSSFP